MNPGFNMLFSEEPPFDIKNVGIKKIEISKQKRDMKIYLDEDVSEEVLNYAYPLLRKKYKLRDVEIICPPKPSDEHDNRIYLKAPAGKYTDKENVPQREKHTFVGKAASDDVIYGSPIRGNLVAISDINEYSNRVVFKGEIFGLEFKDIKSRKKNKEFFIVSIDMTDYTDSITVQIFIDKNKGEEAIARLKSRLKKGNSIVVRGMAKFNDYANEVMVTANAINGAAPVRTAPMDNAPEKRVELHLHTTMSAMDAVNDVKDLVNRAVQWGHKAIAVTDHGVVQSFPDAMKASDYNEKIKVLYGVEGYMVDDSGVVCDGCEDETVDSSFVVFDIETTGLDKKRDRITEIGAVKIENGAITDTWSTFVNPQRPIPENISALTHITDEMVKDAPLISEALPEFLSFCKGCTLVAHNAKFDTGFIKQNCGELGLDYDFAYVDTVMLAKCLYPELHNFRLETVAKRLKVVLDNHHRAVDDAKATADAYICMLRDLKAADITRLADANSAFDLRAASKKNRAYHIIILAKNQVGLRNIYELVSASHLSYFFRTPRIPKSLIEEKREGLILGSACEAGELFRAVVSGADEEELKETASFYDYLEIQPIGNNAYMKASDDFPDVKSDDDLRMLNKRIVELGEQLNKPVCATCDVHFMNPDGADYRKILMSFKGFKDADNQPPLFFRTTEEMLDEFSYLGKEKAFEVVVKNTNLIADMIEDVRPIPKKKCPPVVDGAEEAIINDSIGKAKRIYGDPLPDIVKERLDKELHSITTYGFSVMYRIAQELVRKSLSDGYIVGSRGSVGSSFVAYLSDITEVNSLPAHYICPNCKNTEFIDSETGISGCDLPDKICPKCGTKYNKDGHNIPFETFLGFKGDKEPDIDLNFSGEYQNVIHKYTESFFGEGFVFRAGTIGTVAEKTAFMYVNKYAQAKGISIRNAEKKRLAAGCVGVKRTSGQHPGGIIVVPYTNNIHEFCPIQHPADDAKSDIITTHFDYHKIDENLLKLDELGHDDPTMIKMLEDLTGIEAKTIPLGDADTMSLFTSTKALGLKEDIRTNLGTYGVPEFGTKFVRQMLEETKPTTFSELVRISGLSHGTDVWLGNAEKLIKAGVCDLSHAICTRDDIMIFLMAAGIEAGHAFRIMESVRKGRGLKPEDEEVMRAANVPEWYLESCKKIGYMFPKAHAVAYVTMGFRVAYFKVHYPEAFYMAHFSVRANDFDASIMTHGIEAARAAMAELESKRREIGQLSAKEESVISVLEITIEMYARGISFLPISLYESHATNFLKAEGGILPPLNALPGLGENAAKSITDARAEGKFETVDELRERTGATKSVIEILRENHCLDGIPESDQVSLLDFE